MNEQRTIAKKKALGRGLDAILPEVLGERSPRSGGVMTVPITLLARNPSQARQHFSEETLKELALSMKEHGVLQPIVVRPQVGGRYEIVAGERRWRAAQIAGISEVPVLVRQVSEQQAAEINLIENIQRDDLNPLDEAEACRRLIVEHGYTHEKMAERLGKSRSALTNLLRLLELPVPVQEMIRAGKLSEGHGRALLSIEDDKRKVQVALEVAAKGLSVRETERMAASIARQVEQTSATKKPKETPEIRELCDRLQRRLGTKVNVKHSRSGSGRLEIYYSSLDELDRILAVIFKKP